jgi:hypothetical protein
VGAIGQVDQSCDKLLTFFEGSDHRGSSFCACPSLASCSP